VHCSELHQDGVFEMGSSSGANMRLLLILSLGTISLDAQPLMFGGKGGVPITEVVEAGTGAKASYGNVTNRYLVGPTVEVTLPFGVSIEADALYRHFRYTSEGGLFPLAYGYTHAAGHAWEIPLLAKHRFRKGTARPYVDGGIGWDAVGGESITTSVVTPPSLPPSPVITTVRGGLNAENNVVFGVIVGGGVEIPVGHLHISPEVRYTRWLSQHFTQTGFEYGTLASRQNQAELLMGFTF
jgi:hypothetical protein